MEIESQENRNSQNGSVSVRSQKSTLSVNVDVMVPEGYQEFLIPNVSKTSNLDEATDYATGENRPPELVAYQGLKLDQKMEWQFSF